MKRNGLSVLQQELTASLGQGWNLFQILWFNVVYQQKIMNLFEPKLGLRLLLETKKERAQPVVCPAPSSQHCTTKKRLRSGF